MFYTVGNTYCRGAEICGTGNMVVARFTVLPAKFFQVLSERFEIQQRKVTSKLNHFFRYIYLYRCLSESMRIKYWRVLFLSFVISQLVGFL